MPINRDKLKLDKIWIKVKRESRAEERINTLPREVAQEITVLKEKLLESQLASYRGRYQQAQEEWSKLLAEKDERIFALQRELEEKEKGLADFKSRAEEDQVHHIEQFKEEYTNMVIKQKEEKLKRNLHEKEINIYEQSIDELRAHLHQERAALELAREIWEKKEKSLDLIILQKEEEMAQLREALVEKENRFYHQQAQTEGELNLLRKELARLRNLLSLEQESAEYTVEQAKENVAIMQQQLDKIHQQIKYEEHIKEIDKHTLSEYNGEVGRLKNENAVLAQNFEQERARWKELWEKERSSWDHKKRELQEWEDRLRYERERFVKLTWDGKAPVPHYDPARQEGVGEMPAPPLPVFVKAVDKRAWVRGFEMLWDFAIDVLTTSKFYYAVGTAALCVWLGYYGYLAALPAANVFYPSLHPRAVFYDNNTVYMYMDATRRITTHRPGTLEAAQKEIIVPEGVNDFIVEDNFLWVLSGDKKTITLRFVSDPASVQGSYALDEEMDYLAYDGKDIWSLNAQTQRVNKHSLSQKLRITKRYQLAGLSSGGIAFYNKKMWILDKNTKSFLIYSMKNKLVKEGRMMLPQFGTKFVVPNDFCLGDSRLWMVNTESSFLYYITTAHLWWQNLFR